MFLASLILDLPPEASSPTALGPLQYIRSCSPGHSFVVYSLVFISFLILSSPIHLIGRILFGRLPSLYDNSASIPRLWFFVVIVSEHINNPGAIIARLLETTPRTEE